MYNKRYNYYNYYICNLHIKMIPVLFQTSSADMSRLPTVITNNWRSNIINLRRSTIFKLCTKKPSNIYPKHTFLSIKS